MGFFHKHFTGSGSGEGIRRSLRKQARYNGRPPAMTADTAEHDGRQGALTDANESGMQCRAEEWRELCPAEFFRM